MATTSSPPSPLYEPARRDMFVHPAQQPYFAFASAPARPPYFYAPADAASAASLPHDASAARLAHNQVCPSGQYYGDAAPGVIAYAAEHISHSAHDWLPHKPQHHHADSTQAYARLPPFYDSGEVSPASDDSSGGFYDSPHPSDDARLVDERCTADAHAHTTFPAYDAAASFPSPSLITAERYSYLTGQDGGLQPQPSPTYYEEPTPLVFQPAPQHLGVPFAHDFSGSADEVDALQAHHPQKYLERPPSGDSRPSPAQYRDALVEPQRGARTSPHGYAPQQQRTQSPMAHLPYVEVDPYHGTPDPHAQGFYLPSSAAPYAYAEQQPMCLPPPYHPVHTPIAIPAPRSPPLVEDTPKKPLTLACFFCRKRKIACGSPSSGRKDRTCNQCARRNLRCEYPVNSRRGTRQREVESALYPGSAGYERISS